MIPATQAIQIQTHTNTNSTITYKYKHIQTHTNTNNTNTCKYKYLFDPLLRTIHFMNLNQRLFKQNCSLIFDVRPLLPHGKLIWVCQMEGLNKQPKWSGYLGIRPMHNVIH